jgi:signal transduction histidine kinase
MALATGSTPPLPLDPLQLKRRLVLQGGGFSLLLLAAFSGSLYWGIAVQRGEDQRKELRQLAVSAAAQLPLIVHETREAEGQAKFHGTRSQIAIEGLEKQRVQWFDSQGQLLSEQGGLAIPKRLQVQHTWQQWPGGMSLWRPVPGHGGVRVALSDQAAQADLLRLKRGLLLGGVVTVLAALLAGRRMLRAAFEPLQQQVSALQQFTADASHELRHPLTALRTLLAAVPPELKRQPGLAWRELDTLTSQMGQLLDDLLLLARQQQVGNELLLQPGASQEFDLFELLEDLIRCYQPQAAARSIGLRLTPDPATSHQLIWGHSQHLLRLFTNLVLNAIRHSPEGGTVWIKVQAAARLVTVAVIDQGAGIPASEQEQVFARFWRGSDRGGHSGLGLAIARAIAHRHGGDLRIGDSRPGNCVLLVELPVRTATS